MNSNELLDGLQGGTWEWKTNPETGTDTANIGPVTDTAHTIYQEHEAFLRVRRVSMEGIPTLETCEDEADLERNLNAHWRSVNLCDADFHTRIHNHLQEFAQEVRLRTLTDEFDSATKSMACSNSEDWKRYIVSNAGLADQPVSLGMADQPTNLFTMGERISAGVRSLEEGHKNLTKFMKHIQGIDHTTQKKSRRLLNLEQRSRGHV